MKKKINWDAFYAIGGAIGFFILILVALVLSRAIFYHPFGNEIPDPDEGDNRTADVILSVFIPAVISMIFTVIAMFIPIFGLFFNDRRSQRDSIFATTFATHVIAWICAAVAIDQMVLAAYSMGDLKTYLPDWIILHIAGFVSIIFNALYEGIGNSKQIQFEQSEIDQLKKQVEKLSKQK